TKINMRKMEGLFNDINEVGTAVPKNTTLHYNELKSCSTCKVHLLKMACVQAHLKFASEQLNDSEKAWETVLRSEETKIKLSVEYDPKNTIPTFKHGIGSIILWPIDGTKYLKILDKKLLPSSLIIEVMTLIRLGHYIDGSSRIFVDKWKKPLEALGVTGKLDPNGQQLST
uniref:Uncharacterized protein n=1 Tax=Pundamilia nyererei TaxID=303518 RepID=A0A3B4GNZ4_9CICH